MNESSRRDRLSSVPYPVYLATFGLLMIGVGGIIFALMALFERPAQYLGGGVCGIAAAVSFGQLLNALLRR